MRGWCEKTAAHGLCRMQVEIRVAAMRQLWNPLSDCVRVRVAHAFKLACVCACERADARAGLAENDLKPHCSTSPRLPIPAKTRAL